MKIQYENVSSLLCYTIYKSSLRKFVDKFFFLYQIYRDRANKN